MGDYEKAMDMEEEQRLFDVSDLPTETQQKVLDLETWLREFAAKVEPETLRKAAEYGSSDLEIMGQAMLLLVPKEFRERALGLEMAIAFYALGKVARLFGAYERGDRPSADTWFDLHVYAKMGLKVRETGRWL